MPAFPIRHTFMISYFVDNNIETGIVQAFRFRKSDLYLIALLEENEKTAKRIGDDRFCQDFFK